MGIHPPSGKNMKTIDMLEAFFKSKLDSRGRIYIPKEAREKLAIRAGDKIYPKIENDHFIVYTTKAIKHMQNNL